MSSPRSLKSSVANTENYELSIHQGIETLQSAGPSQWRANVPEPIARAIDAYFMGEKGVGCIRRFVVRSTSGPFFSLAANTSRRSGSARNWPKQR